MVSVSVLVIAVAAGGLYVWKNPSVLSRGSSDGLQLAPPKAGEVPKDLAQTYTSERYGFSVNYPTGFTVSFFENPAPDDGSFGGDTIMIQNVSAGGVGIQIIVSLFDEDGSILTEQYIKEYAPDMVINNVLPVELGANGRGIAFESNNDSYGGASRDVWFVYKGNLYQITTYLSQGMRSFRRF
jgi:hypothetical protein